MKSKQILIALCAILLLQQATAQNRNNRGYGNTNTGYNNNGGNNNGGYNNNGGNNNGGYNNGGYNNNGGGTRSGWNNYNNLGSALTIFSTTNEPFFLILNGVKQNQFAQTRVRIEDLPFPTNEIQIIFNDNYNRAITKRITVSDPMDGEPVSMVLKIVKERGMAPRLAFHQCFQLDRDYRGESGEYIMHYGRDVVRQVTPPPPPPPVIERQPMDNGSFGEALRAIKGSSWDDTRLSTAKTIANTNYFTTDQVMAICRIFSWDESKLDFAQYAYSRTVDYNNYFKVASVFTWDDSKKKLNDFINKGR